MESKHLVALIVVGVVGVYLWQHGGLGKKSADDLVMEQFEQSVTRDFCLRQWQWTKGEIDRRLQYASQLGDMRGIEAYRPLAFELVEIGNRLQNPNCNPAKDEERLRQIDRMITKSMREWSSK